MGAYGAHMGPYGAHMGPYIRKFPKISRKFHGFPWISIVEPLWSHCSGSLMIDLHEGASTDVADIPVGAIDLSFTLAGSTDFDLEVYHMGNPWKSIGFLRIYWEFSGIWAHMGPYGADMGPYGPLWALMGPYGPLWILLDRSWNIT